MMRVPGLGAHVLLLLLSLGFLAPPSAATGPSGAGIPDLEARVAPHDEQAVLDLDASAQAEAAANADGTAVTIHGEPIVAAPGEARAASRTMGAAPPTASAIAATGAAVGLGLLAILAFPFFSRIDSHRILDNGMRMRVHDAIEQNPGITIKEIVRTLDIGWGTAVYHLKRLEAERLIVSERHRQFRRFFKNGGGIANESKGAFAELKHPTTQRLASELLSHPGRAQKDLCAAAGISAPLANKYLGRMEEAQLLTRQREWKTVKYFPTPRLAELMSSSPAAAPILVTA